MLVKLDDSPSPSGPNCSACQNRLSEAKSIFYDGLTKYVSQRVQIEELSSESTRKAFSGLLPPKVPITMRGELKEILKVGAIV